MRKIDWGAIRAEYISTDESYRSLAAKYGVAQASIVAHSKKEGWIAEREKHREKVVQKRIKAKADLEARTRERINVVVDKLLLEIERGLENGSIKASGKGFRDVTGALKDIKELREIRDPLEKQEQMARIEKLRADAKRANEIMGADITITLAPDLEEYTS